MKKRVFDVLLLFVAVLAFAFSWARTALATEPDSCAESCQEIRVWKGGATDDCTQYKWLDCQPCTFSGVTARCIFVPSDLITCKTPTVSLDQEWKEKQTCTILCNIPTGVGTLWFVEASKSSDSGAYVKIGKQNRCE